MRATMASGFAFSVDFGILTFLVEVVHLHYLVSAAAGFVVGTTITYLLSIFWIFPRRKLANQQIEYGLYVGIGVVGIGLNLLLMWILTDLIGLFYMLSRIIAGSTVFFWNFLSRKHLLFR